MKRTTRWHKTVMLLTTLVSLNAHSALINRGGGLIYDTVLDITWMQNANFVQTSGLDPDGFANFGAAQALADAAVFAGYDDWRLPSIKPVNGVSYNISFSFNGTTDRGYNNDSTQTEMGYMFHHNLNNMSFFNDFGVGPQPGSQNFNTSFVDGVTGEIFNFENFGVTYWSSSTGPFANTGWGYNFRTFSNVATGENQLHSSQSSLSMWLVRDGDSAFQTVSNDPPADPPGNGGGSASSIPEPGTLGLLFFGAAGLLATRRQNTI